MWGGLPPSSRLLKAETTSVMKDGTGLAERLLGFDGFRVLEITKTPNDVVSSWRSRRTS